MTTPCRSNGPYGIIFRTSAVQNYMKGREETVLPRFVSPRLFIYLWVLLTLLLMATGLAWYIKYPVYDPAVAIATGDNSSQAAMPVRLVVLLPPTIQIDGSLMLATGQGHLAMTLLESSPEAISPQEFRERFDLDPAIELVVSQPVRVALVEVEDLDLPAELYNGGFFQVNIQTDSRRVISLIPVIGKYFKG